MKLTCRRLQLVMSAAASLVLNQLALGMPIEASTASSLGKLEAPSQPAGNASEAGQLRRQDVAGGFLDDGLATRANAEAGFGLANYQAIGNKTDAALDVFDAIVNVNPSDKNSLNALLTRDHHHQSLIGNADAAHWPNQTVHKSLNATKSDFADAGHLNHNYGLDSGAGPSNATGRPASSQQILNDLLISWPNLYNQQQLQSADNLKPLLGQTHLRFPLAPNWLASGSQNYATFHSKFSSPPRSSKASPAEQKQLSDYNYGTGGEPSGHKLTYQPNYLASNVYNTYLPNEVGLFESRPSNYSTSSRVHGDRKQPQINPLYQYIQQQPASTTNTGVVYPTLQHGYGSAGSSRSVELSDTLNSSTISGSNQTLATHLSPPSSNGAAALAGQTGSSTSASNQQTSSNIPAVLFELYERDVDNQIREALFNAMQPQTASSLLTSGSSLAPVSMLEPLAAPTSLLAPSWLRPAASSTLGSANNFFGNSMASSLNVDNSLAFEPQPFASGQPAAKSRPANPQSFFGEAATSWTRPLTLATTSDGYLSASTKFQQASLREPPSSPAPATSQPPLKSGFDLLASALDDLPTFTASDLQPLQLDDLSAGQQLAAATGAYANQLSSLPLVGSESLDQTSLADFGVQPQFSSSNDNSITLTAPAALPVGLPVGLPVPLQLALAPSYMQQQQANSSSSLPSLLLKLQNTSLASILAASRNKTTPGSQMSASQTPPKHIKSLKHDPQLALALAANAQTILGQAEQLPGQFESVLGPNTLPTVDWTLLGPQWSGSLGDNELLGQQSAGQTLLTQAILQSLAGAPVSINQTASQPQSSHKTALLNAWRNLFQSAWSGKLTPPAKSAPVQPVGSSASEQVSTVVTPRPNLSLSPLALSPVASAGAANQQPQIDSLVAAVSPLLNGGGSRLVQSQNLTGASNKLEKFLKTVAGHSNLRSPSISDYAASPPATSGWLPPSLQALNRQHQLQAKRPPAISGQRLKIKYLKIPVAYYEQPVGGEGPLALASGGNGASGQTALEIMAPAHLQPSKLTASLMVLAQQQQQIQQKQQQLALGKALGKFRAEAALRPPIPIHKFAPGGQQFSTSDRASSPAKLAFPAFAARFMH